MVFLLLVDAFYRSFTNTLRISINETIIHTAQLYAYILQKNHFFLSFFLNISAYVVNILTENNSIVHEHALNDKWVSHEVNKP